MPEENGRTELYHRYRPATFKGVLGQSDAVKAIQQMLKKGTLPHFIVLSGDSGVGKTTLARIIGAKLGSADFREINAANTRGIDTIRSIIDQSRYSPLDGGFRLWLVDEAHRLSADAMDASLKLLEDYPSKDYFVFCTTRPDKIIQTVKGRACCIHLKPLEQDVVCQLLTDVAGKEGFDLSPELRDSIAEACRGSAREALGMLHRAASLESEEDRINSITCPEAERQAIEVFRGLLNPKEGWKGMQKVLMAITEELETVRQMVLSACNTAMLRGKPSEAGRAAAIVGVFMFPFHDSGKAGLTKACWDILNEGK